MPSKIVDFPRGRCPILSRETPEELFVSLLRRAAENARINIGGTIESYMVQLLSRSITGIAEMKGGEKRLSTFAEAYLFAKNQAAGEREETLKGIGDRALLLSGYYSESLIRKTVKPSYYHSMGRAAYAGVADINASADKCSLFAELSERFIELVRVLGEVSELGSFRREKGIVEACEKWIRTRCPSSFRVLVRRGAVPVPHLESVCAN